MQLTPFRQVALTCLQRQTLPLRHLYQASQWQPCTLFSWPASREVQQHSSRSCRRLTVCSQHNDTANAVDSPLQQNDRTTAVEGSSAAAASGPFAKLVGTPIYTAIEVAEFVVLLGIVDAAYSGDWSRIGAISKEMEHALQQVVLVISLLHALCGVAAGNIAHAKGRSWPVAAVKGLLFGALGVYEQVVETKDKARSCNEPDDH